MIIDTMVIAYALLGVERYGNESLHVLNKTDQIIVPDSIRTELLNVVWQWVRSGGVSPSIAESVIEDSDTLFSEVIPTSILWREALALALENNHSPYDTLFIAASKLKKTKLVTYDKKLLRLFPDETISPTLFLKK